MMAVGTDKEIWKIHSLLYFQDVFKFNPYQNELKQITSSRKAWGLYSWGTPFESRPVNLLFWLEASVFSSTPPTGG